MKYRNTPYDFRLQVLPVSGGTFSSFVRSEYQSLDVSGLFEEHIAQALYNTPKVFSAREPFTLVNVTCTHSGFSFGCLPPPPKKVLPLACTWFFTFAISASEYAENTEVKYSSLRWIDTRVWGPKGSQFLTVGISHTNAQHLGLKYDMLTPKIAYYLIGALSKSFVRNHRYWNSTEPADYSYNYRGLMPSLVYSSLYMTPLYNMVNRVPYHMWVFNRHAWYTAPNLLSPKHITPITVLYALIYLRPKAGVLPVKIEDKILELLQSSLLSTLQRAEHKVESPYLDDLLYTALLYRNEIPDNGYIAWLQDKEKPVMEFGLSNVSDYKDYLRNIFYSE